MVPNNNRGDSMMRRDFLKAAPALMAPALAHAQARPLRYISNAGLSTIALSFSGPSCKRHANV
jgi:hypothetical protein